MSKLPLRQLEHYLLALCVTLPAAVVVLYTGSTRQADLLLTVGVVTISSWWGGIGPGILSTLVLSVVSAVSGQNSPALETGSDWGFWIVLLLACGVLPSIAGEARLRARKITSSGSRSDQNPQAEAGKKSVEDELNRERYLLTSLFENSHDSICIKDRKSRFIRINTPLAVRLGCTPSEILGKTDFDLFSTDHAKQAYEDEQRMMSTGVPILNKEEKEVRLDGHITWLSSTKVPLRDQTGDINGMICLTRDITESKMLEERLMHAQKMEAIGRLAGGVAHDFNNLLTAINGYADLILLGLDENNRHRSNLIEIRKAGERAATLTRQLLAFSRKQILQPRVFDLNETIRSLEKMLRRLIGEDIVLDLHLEPRLHSLKADPTQIEQVIMNLVINARDAMPRGGRLTIETKNSSFNGTGSLPGNIKPGPFALMTVSDTGCGMDPETLSHIFEPFFTTKKQGEGTGLGLSTVYGILKQSDGHIRVKSTPGAGSEFRVFLPQVPLPAEHSLDEEKGESSMPGGCSETILLVEDDDRVRTLAREILKKCGFKVIEAVNGQDALRINERYSGPIDLILTDVVMPGISGPDLIPQLMKSGRKSKVLFMSGYAEESLMRRGMSDKPFDFLPKPFTPGELAGKIREVLDRKD